MVKRALLLHLKQLVWWDTELSLFMQACNHSWGKKREEREAEGGEVGGAHSQSACRAWRLIRAQLRQNTGDQLKSSPFWTYP